MSVEESGGGASVGSSDRSGGKNVSDECRIEVDPSFSEQEKEQFVSLEEASKVVNETSNNVEPKIQKDQIIKESSGQRYSEEEKKNEESSGQRFSEKENKRFVSFENTSKVGCDKIGQPAITKPKIQKVPSMLRDNNKLKKYFEPKVFSIGPHYHRDHTLNLKMAKQIKVKLAAKFLEHNGVEKEHLYEVIKEQIMELKDCYDNDLIKAYDDQKLAWMFLVDGCAILQFMYIIADFSEDQQDPETELREFGIKIDYAMLISVDLFLLENQLPYKLLMLIIQNATEQESKMLPPRKNKLLESIYEFLFSYIRSSEWYGNEHEIWNDLKCEHVHLLDLLRKMHIQPFNQIHKKHDFIDIIMDWTADFFYKFRCNRNGNKVPAQFRNIGKLREAGINLKPSETSCVTDISFIGGTLKLPPIILDELTASTFLNILGYEMCPDFHNGSEFISYMYFLDKLIDRTKDVDELLEKNILQNQLGRDEEVAELFNEIGSHLFPNYELYSEVRRNIHNYFDNKGFMWLRKVIHDIHQYFKNRWSVLALIAALIALATGIIQTVYTAFGLSR